MTVKKVVLILAGCLLLAGCGGGGSGDPERPDNDGPDTTNPPDTVSPPDTSAPLPRSDVRDVDQLYPYKRGSAYAALLKRCALVATSATACDLTALPFIGQQGAVSRDSILDRLLVTHDWMGERFEQILQDAPDDLIPLFGSVTSISIGSTIRPSYYWAGTGAIRLDPAGFWLSVYEKSTVAIDDDFRSDFGRDLRFWALRTFRIDGQRATAYYPLTDYRERTLADIKIPVYRLLYHELAHAVDFMPAGQLATIDASQRPVDAVSASSDFWLAPRLQRDEPLFSDAMWALAQVRYRGVEATAAQQQFSPASVGSMMGGDGALQFYGYLTSQEDVATLFAATMLKMHFDVDSHIAFSDKPVDEDNYTCDELLVGWGVYSRLGDSRVLPRARWVYEQIYGGSETSSRFFNAQHGTSQLMTQGQDWCANLANESPGISAADFTRYDQSSGDHQLQNIQLDRQGAHH